jgi:endoglycosylceramidase
MRTHRTSVLAAIAVASIALLTLPGPAGARPGSNGRTSRPARTRSFSDTGPGLISHDGRWLTDSTGRVMLLHGVNMVAKGPQTVGQRGFGLDDVQWLQDNGFDVVRLGLSPDAFMPTVGQVDQAYLADYAQTVQLLTDHGILVLVDLHQDGWGPVTSGNGFPEWMTFTHGAQNTHTGFPLYYVTNPAIQASFDSFWKNEKASDGIGIEDHVATMFKALAGAVGSNPNVIGYDILNEPFPGSNWNPCYQGDGCPDQDASGLDKLHAKVDAAIRTEDPDHLVFGEPYVLFNFGSAPTHISPPGNDPKSGMSWHMYTTDVPHEPLVIKNAIAWSKQTGGALLNTEFGAVTDPAAVNRMVGEMDNGLIPWMWWSYDEFVHDLNQAPTGANINMGEAGPLIRPHPVAVAGTPTALDFDPKAKVMRFSWDDVAPSGSRLPSGTETTFKVPSYVYGGGYSIKVTGGTVTSAANAEELTVVADDAASKVFVKVWPAGDPEPSDDFPGTSTTSTTTPGTTTPDGKTTTTVVGAEPTQAPGASPVSGTSSFTG